MPIGYKIIGDCDGIILLIMVIFFFLFGGLITGCNPIQFFKGGMTDKEFSDLMDKLFSAEDFEAGSHNATGSGIKVWVSNRPYGFDINGIKNFSLLQRLRFYKRLDKELLDRLMK